ncbi:MAG: hypothetical protein Q4C59_06765 [Lachnospiraceae bacterium]|nr:hypothetical protein [Lachnospiraceae bacterium]
MDRKIRNGAVFLYRRSGEAVCSVQRRRYRFILSNGFVVPHIAVRRTGNLNE